MVESRICIHNSTCDLCRVSEWSEWTNCSKECGSGISKRNRQIVAGNHSCDVILEEKIICNTKCCPIDGKWSDWSQWSNCSSNSCEPGFRKKIRKCDSPSPDCNGKSCEGYDSIVEPCLSENCK